MKLAIDNDFFCKTEVLGVAGLILEAFETTSGDSFILPDLEPQFRNRRKGSKVYRNHVNEADFLLGRMASYGKLDVAAVASSWLDKMTGVPGIDPGEAQLLAYVASTDAVLLATHDKVCLRAVPQVDGLASAIAGRVVLVEAALLHACNVRGVSKVFQIVQSNLARTGDNALRSCFGSRESSVVDGLNSYMSYIRNETDSRLFWTPP